MRAITSILLLCLFTTCIFAAKDYSNKGDNWGAECVKASTTSPIQIDKTKLTCEYTQVFQIAFKSVSSSFSWDTETSSYRATGAFATLKAEDVNGDVFDYTATAMYLHAKAEHQFLADGQPDVEIQIYFDGNAGGVSAGKTAAVSLFFSQGAKQKTKKDISTVTKGITMDLSTVFGDMLHEAPTSRYFYYQGTGTYYPCVASTNWYVMETVFQIDQAENIVIQNYISGQTAGQGNDKRVQTVTDFNAAQRVLKRGGCYPGYWTHDMTSNAGIWYMIPFMTIFFVLTLVIEPETDFKNNKNFKDDYRTNHMLYSIMNVSSAIFTRNSRCTLLLCAMVLQMCIQAFCFHLTDKDEWLWMLIFAFASTVITKLITFIYGMMLHAGYQHQKIRWEAKKKEDELKQFLIIQDLDFYFYFVAFFTVVGGWVGICGFLYGKPSTIGTKWLVGSFVGYFIDLAILETLLMFMGKGSEEEVVSGCCKMRGLYFEYEPYKNFYMKKLR